MIVNKEGFSLICAKTMFIKSSCVLNVVCIVTISMANEARVIIFEIVSVLPVV